MARTRATVLAWHGDRVVEIIRTDLTKRLGAAARVVQNHAKVLVGIEGTGTRTNARDSKGRFLKRLVYGANPSRPGEPPHKQTGRLQSSITNELSVDGTRMTARVGTNLNDPPYPRWLEFGTRKMAARPWLRRALDEMRARVKSILTQPIKGPDERRR